MVAALVSYLLSRWAWERKGKPDLLRETLPFWVVSVAVWVILGLTSHYASVWAHSMGYTHLKKHLVVQGAYFLMNCVTFVARFLIFHYVLFANKSRDEEAAAHRSEPTWRPRKRERKRHRAAGAGAGRLGPPPQRSDLAAGRRYASAGNEAGYPSEPGRGGCALRSRCVLAMLRSSMPCCEADGAWQRLVTAQAYFCLRARRWRRRDLAG